MSFAAAGCGQLATLIAMHIVSQNECWQTPSICGFGRPAIWQSAVAAARADWLLCLEPGARLHGDWTEIVADTLAETDKRQATPMRFRPEPANFSIRNLWRRPRALRSGLIILKKQAEVSGAESLEALARGRATRQIAARILPAD